MLRITIVSTLLLSTLMPLAAATSGRAGPPEAVSDAQFQEKLDEMLSKTEKSIKLLREQIVESHNAPFLAELYLQLADLLTQKSNTLYYIQMERQKSAPATKQSSKMFAPVIASQNEAIGILNRILKSFPEFPKRPQVMLRIAAAYKSIDEIPQFMRASAELIQKFPHSDETLRVRLLLGQHFLDGHDFDEAYKSFSPVLGAKPPYERNLAKYKVGLIYIAKERFRDALSLFEQVVSDTELKEQENPQDGSIKGKDQQKSDLKREALVDSIRAYTYVFDKSPNPTAYYSKLAPTELHFQEVIEKLAMRYIHLKKYEHAITLLRTLAERLPDPQRVITIYQEVLAVIPPKDRISIPSQEMRFLLEKYVLWTSYYKIPKAAQDQSQRFFEKQTRELATSSHDLAKSERASDRKTRYLRRAREFYLLYLGFFPRTTYTPKMASNLADVLFSLGDFLHAGDYYLRAFSGEFGKADQQRLLIENAILCLQRAGESGFYENTRKRGLLIKSIESYLAFDPAKRKDPRLNFALAKAEYEQGFYPEVFEKLYTHMKAFRQSPTATDAGELILDYFNTRDEFGGLEQWANRILALKLSNAAFNQKVKALASRARAKLLQEKVKSVSGYDELSQGKSYLAAAEAFTGSPLADEVLQQALAKSKAERDIGTFLQAGTMMAAKEKNPKKRSAILRSIAHEYLATTRYYAAISTLEKVSEDSQFSSQDRVAALDETINTLLLLRDWKALEKHLENPGWQSINAATKSRLRDQLADLVESGVDIPSSFVPVLMNMDLSDEALLALYKAQFRLSSADRTRVYRMAQSRCGAESRQLICRWQQLETFRGTQEAMTRRLASAPTTMEGLEPTAREFANFTARLQKLEGSGDALFETAIALRSYEAYREFGQYLGRAAESNPELRPVLQQKVQETLNSARLYLDRCRLIGEKSEAIRSGTRFCRLQRAPKLSDLFQRPSRDSVSAPSSDPEGALFEAHQKELFASKKGNPDALLELARIYFEQGKFHHAAASASYGLGTQGSRSADFRTILGCAVARLGLVDEAAYHLRSGGSANGLKEKCLMSLSSTGGES